LHTIFWCIDREAFEAKGGAWAEGMVATAPGIREVEAVFGQVILTRRIVTMDALLTQRQVAQTIVEAGGDYVMIVKDNQPQLTADIELVFTLPPPGDRQESVHTGEIGHGRIETRPLTTSAAWVGDSD
jgi:hypothetical protein